MPRIYKRKAPDRSVVTNEQLEAAKMLISKGATKRKAASQVGLSESTLRNRLKLGKAAESMGSLPTFTKAQEKEMYQYVKKCGDLYHGFTMISLRKLIYEYAEINKIPHRFNTSSKLAGRDWVYGFLKRFPELKLRQPTPTSIIRAMGLNKAEVNNFFTNLETLYEKYNFAPSRIFNMDEIGVITVLLPNKIPKMISMKGKKLAGKIVSGEGGQTITLVCAMSVTGNFIPPAFIFPSLQGYLLNNAPDGSIGMVSDSGFINSELFLDYLCHFKDNIQPTKDNPVLLILDNHSPAAVAAVSLAAIHFCRDNNIHVLILPPHSSYRMQPLDRAFFGPLKVEFAYECQKWLSHHPGRVIGQTEVAQLANEAFKKAATLSNAASGFKVSGIWPIDADIFLEEEFAAASAADVIPATNTEETVPTAAARPANIKQEPTASTSREQPLTNTSSCLPFEPSAAATGSKNVYTSKWYGYPYFDYIREKKRPLTTRRTISTDDSQLSPQAVNEDANEDENQEANDEAIEEVNEGVNEEVKVEVKEEANEEANEYPNEDENEDANEDANEDVNEYPNEYPNEDENEDANEDANEDVNEDPNEDADGLQNELEEVPEEPKEELDTDCEEENHALTQSFNVNNDLYKSFGNYIACELRKYDPRTLAYVKHAINNVIFKADLRNLEMDTSDDLVDPPQSPSPSAAEEGIKQSPAVSDAEI